MKNEIDLDPTAPLTAYEYYNHFLSIRVFNEIKAQYQTIFNIVSILGCSLLNLSLKTNHYCNNKEEKLTKSIKIQILKYKLVFELPIVFRLRRRC